MAKHPSSEPAPPTRDPWAWVLFTLALVGAGALLLPDLAAFPLYFFCDEAVHPAEFQAMAANHWHSVYPPFEAWPAFFMNVRKFNLSLSVYAQGFAEMGFGRSVETVRGVTAWCGLTVGAALAVVLRVGFKAREWWVIPAMLAATPCLFLHLRTGFETGLMVVCYAWFLACYTLYRQRHPAWIFPAMLFGAGTFYAYSNGQGVMLISALGLAALDWRHHWAQRRWTFAGLAFAFVLFMPYLRFRWQHPSMIGDHFRDVETYWNEPWPLWKKLGAFVREYAAGWSPRYWFVPGEETMKRHQAVHYGHLLAGMAPLVALGAWGAWRRPETRPTAWLVLVALAAAPFAAALAQINICRVLAMAPVLVLLAALGWEELSRLVRTPPFRVALRACGLGLFLLFGWTVRTDCLALGPQWDHNYGLHGIQWGAAELFRDTLPPLAAKLAPGSSVIVSHTWANAVDSFPRFFGWSPALPPLRLAAFSDFFLTPDSAPTERDLVVLTPEEFSEMRAHPAVEGWVPRARLRWPDGRVGFHLGHLRLRSNLLEILAQERAQQAAPVTRTIVIRGEEIEATVSGLDGGDVQALLTGADIANPDFTVRCYEGLPFALRVRFPTARRVARISVHRCKDSVHELQFEARRNGGALGEYSYRVPTEEPDTIPTQWKPPEDLVDEVIVRAFGAPKSRLHLHGIEISY